MGHGKSDKSHRFNSNASKKMKAKKILKQLVSRKETLVGVYLVLDYLDDGMINLSLLGGLL